MKAKNSLTKVMAWMVLLLLLASSVTACAPAATPVVVKETVVVEKVVTKEVEKIVEKEVVVTKEVEKVVEKEVVVTATPEPGPVKVVIALRQEPTTLDPQANPANWTFWVTDQVFDMLVWVNPETQEFEPGLAKSWKASDDGLTYTFELRDDVTFHDGTPFNAEAVCFNFERIMDPATESTHAKNSLGPYESCEALGEYEAAVHLSEPFGAFMEGMATDYLVMVSPTAAKELGDRFFMKPVGTGPFVVKEFVILDHVTLVRNPDYNWGPSFYAPGPAQVDVLEFRVMPEEETRVATLLTGETQIISDVPPQSAAMLKEDPGVIVVSVEAPGVPRILQINTQRPPTDELAVRQALNYAVDRNAFCNELYDGVYTPAYSILSPSSLYYDKSKKCELYHDDAEKAKELLEEAGWKVGSDGIREKDGKPLKIDLLMSETTHWGEPAELLQAQLREVGIDLKISEMARGAWYDEIKAGNHNLSCWFYQNSSASILRGHFHSSFIGQSSNYSRFSDPEMDRLTDEVLGISDPEKAREYYDKIQCMAMENSLFMLFWNRVGSVATKSNVKGAVFNWSGNLLFQPLTVE